MRNRLFSAMTLLLALPLSAAAQSLGFTEINQNTLVNGDFSIGDSPGAPVTITVPGNYRLTSDIDVSGYFGTGGIVADLSSGAITIDLNGYTLKGTGSGCIVSGNNPAVYSCPAQTTQHGISRTGSGSTRFLTITNGNITGFTGNGISCQSCVIRAVNAHENRGWGISASAGTVNDSVANFNGFGGVDASLGAVRNVTARGNARRGVVGGSVSDVYVSLTYAATPSAVGPSDLVGVVVQDMGHNVHVNNTQGGIGISVSGYLKDSSAHTNLGVGISGSVRDSSAKFNAGGDIINNPVAGLNICGNAVC